MISFWLVVFPMKHWLPDFGHLTKTKEELNMNVIGERVEELNDKLDEIQNVTNSDMSKATLEQLMMLRSLTGEFIAYQVPALMMSDDEILKQDLKNKETTHKQYKDMVIGMLKELGQINGFIYKKKRLNELH